MALENLSLDADNGLALDTPLLIYFLEGHPVYVDVAQQIMKQIEFGTCTAVPSVISITELTVQPLGRNANALASALDARVASFPNLRISDVDRKIARTAAEIRARFGFRLPDAIHLATAIAFNADVFITNDRSLRQFSALPVLVLSDFVH